MKCVWNYIELFRHGLGSTRLRLTQRASEREQRKMVWGLGRNPIKEASSVF